MTDVRRCWACLEFYPLTTVYFRQAYNTSTGLSGKCRQCRNSDRRELRAAKKAGVIKPPKPTDAERCRAYRKRKKAERMAQMLGGLRGV